MSLSFDRALGHQELITATSVSAPIRDFDYCTLGLLAPALLTYPARAYFTVNVISFDALDIL